MIESLIKLSITRRWLMMFLALFLVAVGMWSYQKLPIDAVPDITNVQVQINTRADGYSPLETEQRITYVVETSLMGIPNLAYTRSLSRYGLSQVTVVFEEGTDIYFARQLVFERLQSAKELIPAGVGTPEIGSNTSGLGQVYQYLLLADENSGYDSMSLRSLNDWVVKLLLMPVDGVTDVLAFGGNVKQFQVNINPSRLLAYQLTQEDIATALERNNSNAGGWYMDRGQEQLVIRSVGWLSSEEKGLAELKREFHLFNRHCLRGLLLKLFMIKLI